MSRFEVPLKYRTLRATGDTDLWADLVLSLKTNGGGWVERENRDRGRRLLHAAESRRQTSLSGSLHRRVDFALVGQPGHVAPLGVLLDLS
jgi:hypothetical protein